MLELYNATKYYKHSVALDRLDFKLDRGEVVGLFGENGVGKTTMLKAMMGLLGLNSGYVILDDANPTAESREKLSFITEEGSFFHDMTPRGHNEFYKDILPCFNSDRFMKLVDFFELPLDKKARTLSRGQQAKLEIAVGMSRGADYILMDEPFLGKDVFTRRDFLKLMIAMLDADEGIVIATHQINEIEMYITRAVIIKDGKIITDHYMDDLIEQGISLLELIKTSCGYDENRVMQFLC